MKIYLVRDDVYEEKRGRRLYNDVFEGFVQKYFW